MNKCCVMLAGLCLLIPNVHAQQSLAYGVDLAFLTNEGPGGSNFNESWRFSAMVVRPSHQLQWEAGLSQATTTEDRGTDNTGSYRLQVSSGDVFAGIRLQSRPVGQVTAFGRGGVLYYYSEIKFSEAFFGIKPTGKIKEVEEGKGYYLGGGLVFPLNAGVKLTGEVSYRKRLDYFEGANAEYDMEELGVAVGLLLNSF